MTKGLSDRVINSSGAHATSIWDVRIGKRRTGHLKTQWADTFKRAAVKQ
jgi:hypothetical protein